MKGQYAAFGANDRKFESATLNGQHPLELSSTDRVGAVQTMNGPFGQKVSMTSKGAVLARLYKRST